MANLGSPKHKAVQVDGETDLPVRGEVHTTFTRKDTPLKFSALVVDKLGGADILGSANFIKENDIVPRMSNGTIQIGDSMIGQATPSAIASLERLDSRAWLVGSSSSLLIFV